MNNLVLVKNLFGALILEQSRVGINEVVGEWFPTQKEENEEYSAFEIYNTIKEHVRRYEKLPDFEFLRERRIFLTEELTHGFGFYLDAIKNEQARVIAKEHLLTPLNELIRRNDYSTLPTVLRAVLSQLSDRVKSNEISTLAVAGQSALAQYTNARIGAGKQGITSGWSGLDDATNGFQPGRIYVIAARPGSGKTMFLVNFAISAWKSGASVLFTSLEMSKEEIELRATCTFAGVNTKNIEEGLLDPQTQEYFKGKCMELSRANNFHIMAGDMRKSVGDVDLAMQQTNPDVIFIDAAYLLKPDTKRKTSDGRRETISDVLEDIKRMAIARNRAVVISVQFNRQVKKKSKADLDLGFLAETDVIGQIASVVLGVKHGKAPHESSRRIVHVLKNRNGREEFKFEVNFNYSGMDFSYIGTVEDSTTSYFNTSSITSAVDWMATGE